MSRVQFCCKTQVSACSDGILRHNLGHWQVLRLPMHFPLGGRDAWTCIVLAAIVLTQSPTTGFLVRVLGNRLRTPRQTSLRCGSELDDIDVVGKTAFTANACRVISERNLSKPLYFDAFGHVFLNRWTENHLKGLGDDFACFIWEMPIRTVFYDEHVRHAIATGIKQIVIIGSGLDCRPLRLHHPDVQFFEFDRDAVLEYKLAQLSTLPIPSYPSRLIRGDYLEHNFTSALQAAGFEMKAPALFLWEGNSMYIQRDRGISLLRHILQNFPQSKIAFDFVTEPICGSVPATDETQWFYDLSAHLADDVGVSGSWEPYSLHQFADNFQVVQETNLWDLALKYRDEAALKEIYGSRRRFEKTQGWMKHYMHVCIRSSLSLESAGAKEVQKP